MGERADRLDAEAMAIMGAATIVQLKQDCTELAALFDQLSDDQRERLLDLLFPDLPRE
ncbi:hypothetical protein ABID65_000366 [Bradyrhizobium sp. S3.9.2]|uniref:hypothetical protein n=1 Tax=Bradyrhizobium sp. S3.9.2 TaxID=3156432 RepID=UPI0033938C1B